MLDQLNKYLPSITLFFLIVALYIISSSATQTQIALSEQSKVLADHQTQIIQLGTEQSSHAVRLTRIELELCSQRERNSRGSRMVQCP